MSRVGFKLGQKRAKESHFHVGPYSFAATAAAAAQSVAAPAPDVMAPPDQPVAVAVSLRDWLVHDAHVSQRLLDGIISTLTYRKVSTVDGLSRLHAEVGLQDVIKGMTGVESRCRPPRAYSGSSKSRCRVGACSA